MTIDTSTLPAGQPVSIRWIRKNQDGSFTDAGGRDSATFNTTTPGLYWAVAWAQDPSVPHWRGALIWLDAEQRFGFRQGGGWREDFNPPQYDDPKKGGYVSVFQSFTV